MGNPSKLQVSGNRSGFLAKSSEQFRQLAGNRIFGFAVKLIVSTTAIGYIGHKIWTSFQSEAFYEVLGLSLSVWSVALLIIPMTLLMASNWGVEVVKWKLLISKEYPISWRRAVKSILSGTTFGVFSPNRSGEFLGRVIALPMGQRMKGAVLSFVNGIAQTLATYTFGVFGIILLLDTFGGEVLNEVSIRVLQITLVLTVIILLTLFLNLKIFIRYLASIRFVREKARYINVLKRTDRRLLIRLYNWSLLRFCIFLVQYWLVFHWIGADQNLSGLLIASTLSLFSSTIVPFLPIPDLLIRESVALSYFELYGFESIAVSAAVLFIWLFNIAFPAIIGAIVLFTYRIFKG